MGLFYDDCSYYQVKIPISFLYRWKSNSKSLVQLREPLLVELIKPTKTFNNHEIFLLLYITWPPTPRKNS